MIGNDFHLRANVLIISGKRFLCSPGVVSIWPEKVPNAN